MHNYVTKDEHNKLSDQVSDLTTNVASLASSVNSIHENQQIVFKKLDSIGDSLNTSGKTNWQYVISVAAIIVTLGVFMFSQTSAISAKLQNNSVKAEMIFTNQTMAIQKEAETHKQISGIEAEMRSLKAESAENTHELDLWWAWRLDELPILRDRLTEVEGKVEHLFSDHPTQDWNHDKIIKLQTEVELLMDDHELTDDLDK